jgi:ubiquinone/menaquinone biosynthesis C-methylase UbiE
MTGVQAGLVKQRGDYGVDGGITAVAALAATGAAGLLLAGLALLHTRSGHKLWGFFELLGGLLLLQVVPSYLYSTRRGKFVVWARLLASLSLKGDEHVLDMGCGRGAVLSILAKLVPRGRAVGLDLWRPQDQSGNSPEATWRNLDAEGVRDRCELYTGDMRAMPFPDAAFDLVVSSFAIHNIKDDQGQTQALDEAIRVLKPGGRLLIADLMWTKSYAQRLREVGMEDVVERHLDWRFWYGALWGLTGLVTANKPINLE